MEEAGQFIPGLVRVVEERLGRIGRPVTTVVVVVMVLGLTTFFAQLFWKGAIAPLIQVLGPIVAGKPTLPSLSSTVSIALSIAIPIAAVLALWFFVRSKLLSLASQVYVLQRRLQAAASLVAETRQQIQSLEEDRQRIAELEQAITAGHSTQASQTSIMDGLLDLMKRMIDRQDDFQRKIFEIEGKLKPPNNLASPTSIDDLLDDLLRKEGTVGGPASPTFREYLERNKDTPGLK